MRTVALALLFAAGADAQIPTSVDPSGAWFRPSLEINEDVELCAALLDAGARDFFAMSRVRTEVRDWSPLLVAVPMTPSSGPLRPLRETEDPAVLVRAGPRLRADEGRAEERQRRAVDHGHPQHQARLNRIPQVLGSVTPFCPWYLEPNAADPYGALAGSVSCTNESWPIFIPW